MSLISGFKSWACFNLSLYKIDLKEKINLPDLYKVQATNLTLNFITHTHTHKSIVHCLKKKKLFTNWSTFICDSVLFTTNS